MASGSSDRPRSILDVCGFSESRVEGVDFFPSCPGVDGKEASSSRQCAEGGGPKSGPCDKSITPRSGGQKLELLHIKEPKNE